MHARRYVLAVLSAISFAGAVVVAPAASAVTVNLYVATAGNGGSNSNDCSQTHPCLTIAYAISQGTPTGTTVHVGAGSFAENVSPGPPPR